MAASNAHLPTIGTLDVSADHQGNKRGAAAAAGMQSSRPSKRAPSSFLSGLQLGSLRPGPRPGDTYHGPVSSRHRRPLGLLPDHNDRLAALKKLNQLLSPWTLGQRPAVPLPPPPVPSDPQLNSTWPPAHSELSSEDANAISASVHLKTSSVSPLAQNIAPSSEAEFKSGPNCRAKDGTAYRLSHEGLSAPVAHSQAGKRDPDYMGDRVREYYAMVDMAPMPALKTTQHFNTSSSSNTKGEKKKAKLKRYDHAPISNVRYLNFTGQAQLFERVWTDDKRSALDYEPCERCRLRGTRCSHCKAIRTGGGYIILDTGDNPDAVLNKRRGFDFAWSGRHGVMSGGGGARGGRTEGLVGSDEDGRGWGGVEGEGGEGGVRRGGTGVGGGVGSGGRWGGGEEEGRGGWGTGAGSRVGEEVGHETGGGGLIRSGTQSQRHQSRSKEEGGAGGEGDTYTGPAASHVSGKQHSLEGGVDEGVVSTGENGGRRGGDLGERVQWEESGRDSRGSRPVSQAGKISRPGSTLGPRPGSSLRGSGRGGGGMDGRGKRSKGGRKGAGDEDEDENLGKDGRRRGRKPSARDGEGRGHGEYEGSRYTYRRDDEEDEDKGGYRGNLMKFKRKRDDVKALHATLKELQGIDPLDYLAKYCIIDQTKLPHYQHVFNNVDRDEDDEIDIGELDFALKAVNYDLISDAEMNYVHSVLELAGRYSLNFRLFSLIAALSEKVVALEDMVKRLINKMDFDALEVKMKKCKELFYLLADSDAPLEHEGGVVTTNSLAVELQAGGLTQEHVDFVVDRLNHEGKGLVEFLDYLTYVPLFVEIHDAISGNPLDFSRTK